jgi:hypothetical protein
MALNTNALTLLVTAKDHLDIAPANTDYDSRIERVINQASELIASYCGRVLVDATHTEFYDGRRANKLTLQQYPITGGAATGGKPELFLGVSGAFDAPVDPDNYYFDDNDIVYPTGFSKGTRNIQVIYDAGLGIVDTGGGTNTLPADLELACLDTVQWLFDSNSDRRLGKTSVSKGDESVSYGQTLPQHITDLLDSRYVRFELPALAPVGVRNG